jgi:hypothetical protein
MISMPHPPYSQDSAPSDFYLFPTVNERFEYAGITNDKELFEELYTIVRAIPSDELESVFEAWLGHVRSVNQGDGSYID